MKLTNLRFLFAIGLVTASVSPCHAQNALVGHVQDVSGASIPGAIVTISTPIATLSSSKTDAIGVFHFQAPDGDYLVSIQEQGFFPIANQSTHFDRSVSPEFFLHIASGGEVEVTGGAQIPTSSTPPPCKFFDAKGHCITPQKWDPAAWDFGVLVEGGNGLEDRTSFKFLSAGVHLGKILTGDFGSGPFKANFEYAIEAFPLWQSYTPTFQRINCPYNAISASQCSRPTTTGGTYRGVSIIPIILRLNLRHGRKLEPWMQGAGGLIYTTRKYPGIGGTNYLDASQTAPNADTSVWNFDPQFGIGAHYFLKPRRSIDVSANAVHISSSSLGDKNPGVNTGVQFTLGYSWWK